MDYSGHLGTHLPEAIRLIIFKGDGSVPIHSEFGYKPLTRERLEANDTVIVDANVDGNP